MEDRSRHILLKEYSIRKASLEDLPVLLEFEQGLIRDERPFDPTIKDGKISYYSLEELIIQEKSDIYVVEKNGTILASGSVKIKKDRTYLKHDVIGYLGFMYVRPEARGLGLNQLIVDALEAWCRQRGLSELKLTVYSDNLPALRAYNKAGFQKHMITMRKNLSDKSL